VFDPQGLDADIVLEPRDLVQRRRPFLNGDARFERQRVGIAPDALSLEVVEGGQVGVADLEQSVTFVARVSDIVEGSEGVATLDALEPDAIVGVCRLFRLIGRD